MENRKLNRLSADNVNINIKETILQYLVYWKWFILSLFISFSIAYTYLRYSKKIYQTTAKIKILDNSENKLALPSVKSDLTQSFEEVKKMRQGKIKKQSLQDFLNEL